ncbi:hypothetical protein EQV77_08840 [Halobacillus fulvus]|nr:hypothetical protein EQV77_08840 [Halobacillus fulvus]
MQSYSRDLYPLSKIWLDETPTRYTHAFLEQLDYEWMVEIVNPHPLPYLENKDYVLELSIELTNGTRYPSLTIESFDIVEGNEFTVYRFFMYPPE